MSNDEHAPFLKNPVSGLTVVGKRCGSCSEWFPPSYVELGWSDQFCKTCINDGRAGTTVLAQAEKDDLP